MAAENKTELPSGSVDGIPKDADESVKAAKWGTTGAFPFEVATRAPNRSDALKTVSDMLESRGVKVVGQKIEKNGSISMNLKLPDGGESEIVVADQHRPLPNSESEIWYKKGIGFLKAAMVIEFTGEDKKEMLVKLSNLPPEFEIKDVEIEVEKRKLVLKLITELEENRELVRSEELPVDATGSAVSTLMEGRTLVLKFTLEKPKPEEKPKSIISKIWRFAKGAVKKAGPACVAVGAKMGFDEMNNDEPNAEPEAEQE
ncbi:hypothetical protein CICLE_v10005684mg [Citrus x clementina]|uniref:Uncharacterized protein n=1 Tax=Citrus clementina TaxID=85681 RepID=V4RJT8_CITCL|nr:hypothetical protein CICLE_v10005684mg [Citrus x clementina]